MAIENLVIIDADSYDTLDLGPLLEITPKLKSLEIAIITDEMIQTIAIVIPKLVHLSFGCLDGKVEKNQRCSQLNPLSVGDCEIANIIPLLQRYSQLEVFELGNTFSCDLDLLIDMLLQHSTLQHLIFRSLISEGRHLQIFNKLKSNYGSLTSLKFDCISNFISFKFPTNAKDWKVKHEEARFSQYGW